MTTMYHQLNIIFPSSQSDSKALFAHHLNSNSSKLFVIWKNLCSTLILDSTKAVKSLRRFIFRPSAASLHDFQMANLACPIMKFATVHCCLCALEYLHP